MEKKKLILKAFENLDAEALGNLLDKNKTYQDVPMELFVERYREYFKGILEDDEIICDFKAYKGKCNGCSKGKSGFSFVNSEGICFAHLVFIEGIDEFLDIYLCNNFISSNNNININFPGVDFFDDEKVGYLLTFDELVEKEFCLNAINCINEELNNKNVLSLEFIKDWQKKYEPIYGDFKLLNQKNYYFIALMQNYLGNIRNALSFIELNNKASLFINLYEDKIFDDDEMKIIWLISCLEELPDVKYHLHAKINEENQSITFGRITISLKYMHDYITLQKIFEDNSYLLPYSLLKSFYPFDWNTSAIIDNSDFEWDEDDDYPF